jgi:hypothetical protein
MAEVETAIQETTEVKLPKVASLGHIKTVQGIPEIKSETTEEATIENKVEAANPENKNQEGQEEKKETTATAETTTTNISEEQRKAFLKEMFGDENFDVEAAKEKLKPTQAEPTEEEKKKVQSEKELRLLKLFVEQGGTPEQYNEIKNIANGDKVELSKKKALTELMSNGFSEAEANEMMKQEFYQIELDNIEQDFENETDEEFEARKKALQKKIEYGAKKLERYSSYEQKQAAEILKGLSEAIESKDLEAKEEAAISSNVDELLSKLPRKQTIELGKYNDVQLAPVEHEVSEDSIKQVQDILKDPAKRNNFFNNQDGTLNLPKLTEVLLNHIERNRAIKNALLEGQTRMTAEFRKTFPATTAYELGVGGSPHKNTGKGVATKIGEPKRVSPQYN